MMDHADDSPARHGSIARHAAEQAAEQAAERASEHATEPASAATPGFPGETDRCEDCGYPLRLMSPTHPCPECGRSIASSDPIRRIGLPWQNAITPVAWLRTALAITTKPRQTYRLLDSGRPSFRARLFLLVNAMLVGCLWYIVLTLGQIVTPWFWALVATLAVVLLSYVEMVGVWYVSRRRGRPIRFAMAERVVAYASIAWLPASLVLAQVAVMHLHHTLQAYWPSILDPLTANQTALRDVYMLTTIACVCVLGLEVLIWLGVAQNRYANHRAKGIEG